jgi:hypothetical protein
MSVVGYSLLIGHSDNNIMSPIAARYAKPVSSKQTIRQLERSGYVMGQKALQPLFHPMHLLEVQRDGICDIRNLDIPDEFELQVSKTLIVTVIRIWEARRTGTSAAEGLKDKDLKKKTQTLRCQVRQDAVPPTVSRYA